NTYQNLFLLEDHTKTLLTLGRLLDSVGNKNAILFIKAALENGINETDIGSISEYDQKLLQLSGLANFGSSVTSAINVLKGVSLFNQANTYLNEGSYEEAKRCFNETMKLLPNHTTSLAGYAIVLKQLGESDAAIETMVKAISLEPGNIQLIKILADLHSEIGNYKEAIHIYRQLIALDPNNTDLLMSVAKLQLTLEDYTSAEKLTLHVLEIEPKNQLAISLNAIMKEKKASLEVVNV
ncbi:MAG: tetratricopeptide repeat protein, partial [Ignavibacteria bacterium]|nr:tetratricopeptide repeat protein [Ignavibacteria bacterium]